MNLTKPIFIAGVGRSGSTVFHQVFAKHPSVAWLSSLCDAFPDRPGLNRALMGALDLPVAGRAAARAFEPLECYPFWDHHYRGFSTPCRDLRADDAPAAFAARIRRVFGGMLTARRHRLLVKITGWPRIRFLRVPFPDAKFIHVLRDGRAVAMSLLNVDWWDGWRGPTGWKWGELAPEYRTEWECHDRSFVALAGIQWKMMMDALEAAKEGLGPDSFLEVRYEDLCRDPVSVMRRATEFAELEWSPRFEASVRGSRLRSENEKWRKDLTPEQQGTLHAVLGSYLSRYGYR